MTKAKKLSGFLYLLSAVFLAASLYISIGYSSTGAEESESVQEINQVNVTIGSNTGEAVSLPHSFQSLSPRTAVTIDFEYVPDADDSIYVKTVYAPLKVYANDSLIFEYGKPGDYPSFMKDPPTAVKILSLPHTAMPVHIRLEYFSPAERDVMTVHPVVIGHSTDINEFLFQKMGFSLLFSIIQIFLGVFLIFIALIILYFGKSGVSFLYLGLFSLSAGVWAFGECNLSGLLVSNPTLLYLMAFAGLFLFAIPLMQFTLTVIDFRFKKALEIIKMFMLLALCAAFILQLSGTVSLFRTVYLFHLLIPISLSLFAAAVLWEGLCNKNPAARKFFLPLLTLAIFAVLEVINYHYRFTNVLSLFFQIGVMIFILMIGVVTAFYIRDSLILRTEKHRLEYELLLTEKQLEAQKERHQMLIKNEEAIRAQRHDLRHQLTVIRSYAQSRETEKLLCYLDSLIVNIPTEQACVFCENTAVNAIVSYYCSLARKDNIDMSIRLSIPEHNKNINDISLCVIIGNLLENGVEASRQVTDGHRFIRMNGLIRHDTLTITMDNSFNGKYSAKNGRYCSSKHDGTGIGLSSIEAVAQKHGGGVRFEAKENVFLSSVYLHI